MLAFRRQRGGDRRLSVEWPLFSSVGELPDFVFERSDPVTNFFDSHRFALQEAKIVNALVHVMHQFLMALFGAVQK